MEHIELKLPGYQKLELVHQHVKKIKNFRVEKVIDLSILLSSIIYKAPSVFVFVCLCLQIILLMLLASIIYKGLSVTDFFLTRQTVCWNWHHDLERLDKCNHLQNALIFQTTKSTAFWLHLP